jgi:DNA topoisomerase-3
MKTIFITEKPSVAQEYKKVLGISTNGKHDGYVEGYSSVLGKDVQITWAVGHLIALASVDEQIDQKVYSAKELKEKKRKWSKSYLPVIPENYIYTLNPSTASQFKVVKSLYTQSDVEAIYYAGDSGREGIYIQALIRNQIFKNKDPKCKEYVVWIDSFTEEEILRGIREAKPYHAYDKMIASGYKRAISDWLIGMNCTQAFTLTSGTLINTGRVMTPTLAMIVDRQKAIDDFKVTPYFGINSVCDFGKTSWKADKKSRFFESNLLYNESGFKDRIECQTLLDEFNTDKHLKVESKETTEKTEYAPLLFNLADLQAYCSKAFGLSPTQTLGYAQSLYEKKMTTYPRTDARVLSSAVAKDIEAKFHKKVPAKYVDDSKITDHYAIIPTGQHTSISGMEEKVYNAILTRYNAIFMPPYKYNSVATVFVHSNGEHFYLTEQITTQLGFRELYGEKASGKDNGLKAGDVVNVTAFEINAMETKAPAPYTQGSIITAMEKCGKEIDDKELADTLKGCGIGTSATRAGILDKLIDKGFVGTKGKVLFPTEKGKLTIEMIRGFDENLTSPVKTAEMEQKLNDIASGSLSEDEYSAEFNEYIKEIIELIFSKNTMKISKDSAVKTLPCPCCGKDMKYGRYGRYCECGFNFPKEICKAKLTEKDIESLALKGKTSAKQFISKNGKKFFARLAVDKKERKLTFDFSTSKE